MCNKKLIEGLAKIKGYYDYGIFSPIQVSGIVALRDCDDDVRQQASVYQNRRDTLCQGLESMGWAVQKPGARMFAWVPIPEPYCRLGSMKFAIHMMENANVAVAPGIGFGQEGEGYLRLRWWKTNIASAKPYGRCDAPFPHSPMSQIYTTPLTASVRSDRE